jgi:hypothetical protein
VIWGEIFFGGGGDFWGDLDGNLGRDLVGDLGSILKVNLKTHL